MMDEDCMAAAIAHDLNKLPWRAESHWDEITFTNEDGEKFLLTVSKIDSPSDEEE